MKRAAIYTRVSTCDQNPETQALDLRRLAEHRGFEIVHEYSDRISGTKAKRPALDKGLGGIVESTKNTASAIRTHQTGKVFKVVGQNVRECLICEQFFTRRSSAKHVNVACHPSFLTCEP